MTDTLEKMVTSLQRHYWRSPFYSYLLGGHVPQDLPLTPIEPWRGDGARGRKVIKGVFPYGDQILKLSPDDRITDWLPDNASVLWREGILGLDWLCDLAKVGDTAARRTARSYISDFMTAFRFWHDEAWRPDILGQRVANILITYPALFASARDGERAAVLECLTRNCRHLFKLSPEKIFQVPLPLVAIRGMIYGGACLPMRETLLTKSLALLPQALAQTLDKNGCVRSRNPCDQLYLLRDLVDMRKLLRQARVDVPEVLTQAIQLVMQMLQAMRQADDSLAPFHGGFSVDGKTVSTVMGQAGPKPRLPTSLVESGYLRVQHGRSLLLVDIGERPRGGHRAPCSFVFGHARDRLIVNCGNRGSGRSQQPLSKALRGAGAHSTLQIERGASVRRDPQQFRMEKQLIKDDRGSGVALTHDAYADATNILHRRSLWLEMDGHVLHGEDLLYQADTQHPYIDDVKPVLRFHLDASVTASLIRNQTEVLLRTQGGIGWRFQAGGHKLKLEDSIQISGPLSKPRSCQQIVLALALDDPQPRAAWSFSRETGEP